MTKLETLNVGAVIKYQGEEFEIISSQFSVPANDVVYEMKHCVRGGSVVRGITHDILVNSGEATIVKDNQDKSLNGIVKSVHLNAVSHGWWDQEREFGTICMLITSEIAEAFEHFRDGKPAHFLVDGKPDGIAVELADVVIRVMDYFGYMGWDLEKTILEKHEYNKTRPYKHGGKKA